VQIDFKNKIVAFIDVLGFKNLLDKGEVSKLKRYIEFVAEEINVSYDGYNIDYLLISDTIVIYTDYDERHFANIIRTVSMLQARLLTYKILLRGSITSGKLYTQKSKNIIVGQGLINAYLLEQKAIFPRVIIDREFLKHPDYKKILFKISNEKWINSSEYTTSLSGFIYVNYLLTLVTFRQFYLNNRLNEVYILLKENIYSNIHFEKYNWLRTEFDKALSLRIKILEKKITEPQGEKKRQKKDQRLLFEILDQLKSL